MYKQTVNTYQGGMSQDISPNKSKQDTYYEAENFHVTTREGGSLLAIENEEGNDVVLSIPDTYNGYKIVINNPYYFNGVYANITIGGTLYTVEVGSTTYADANSIYDLILSYISSEVNNGNVKLELVENSIYIIGINKSLTVTDVNATEDNYYDQIIEGQTDLKIIGVGSVRDWVVLFTTNNSANEPNGSYGQIWKCRYAEGSNSILNSVSNELLPSYHLVYNGKLNFSTANRILDIKAKYVSDEVVKVYWSDYYNYLRHINIADDDALLSPEHLFDIVGNVSFSNPVLKNIKGGGQYTSGKVQYAYQYYTQNGTVTKFSPASATYHLTSSSLDTNNTYNYIGTEDGEQTGKSMEVEIPTIDPDYEYVRVVAIHYADPYQNPVIGIVGEYSTNGQSTGITVLDNGIYTGNYTIEEYGIMATIPFIPKTLAVKDNRLIAANTREPSFDVAFDARAYRSDISGVFKVEDSYGNETTLSSPTFDLPEKHDAINPDQYTYKFDGAGNFGGAGKNISYRLQSREITLDDNVASRGIGTTDKVDTTYNLENKTVYLKGFDNYASPFFEELVGYQRDETYRFGIVFYNHKGQPSFPKWIADIKIPSIPESAPYVGKLFYMRDGQVKAKVPYLQFNVDIPLDISSEIGGWEIVRLERTEDNKSIIAQGLVEQMMDNSDLSELCTAGTPYSTLSYANRYFGDAYSYKSSSWSQHIHRFISPELETNDDFVANGGLLEAVGHVNAIHSYYSEKGDDSSHYAEYTLKNKQITDSDETYSGRHISVLSQVVGGISGEVYGLGSLKVWNYRTCVGATPKQLFKGKCLFIEGDNWFYIPDAWTVDDGSDPGSFDDTYGRGFIFANYKSELQKQYGGNTYEDRSSNIYVSTGSYVSGSGGIEGLNVFGGDTYIAYYDYLNGIINSNEDYADSWQDAIFIPVETTSNLNLRHDQSFSRRSGGDEDSYHNMLTDTFAKYNSAYSREANIRNYVSKPIGFKAIEDNDVKLLISDKKVGADREDSWLVFRPNNEGEVDSRYGAINRILNFKDKLMFYQDSAFGMLAVNERIVTQTEAGAELVLGSGNIFGDYGYISTMSGAQHHGGVCQSNNYLYHYDAFQRRFMQYNIGVTEKPLSELKGMGSFFEKFSGYIKTQDNVLRGNEYGFSYLPVGVTSMYDNRYNRVLFSLYDVYGDDSEDSSYTSRSRTISFNELIGSFESLYSYKPALYHNHRGRMLSCPLGNSLYEHGQGDYGDFYGTKYASTITHLLSVDPYFTKMFTNHEFDSQVTDSSGDIYNETFDMYRAWNSYQDTGNTTLSQPSPMRRIFRNWRIGIPFAADSRARMADRHLYAKLSFTNNANKRLIAHDLVTWYSLRKY